MRSRLAWAFGGFVLVALVVYRFLTRTRVAGPAAAAAETATGAVTDAAAGAGDPDERVAALRRKLEAAREAPVQEEPADDAPAPASTPDAPAPASTPGAPASMPGAPAEAPLDERRRAVHEAGRDAADAMRQAGERPGRSGQPGVDDPAAGGPADPRR